LPREPVGDIISRPKAGQRAETEDRTDMSEDSQEKKSGEGNWKDLLESDLFKAAGKTQYLFKRAEKIEKKQRKLQRVSDKGLKYKETPIHLFPEHPKAPYLQEGAKYAEYEINIAYMINYLMDLKADLKGDARCSPEALIDRNYIALMARETYLANHNRRPVREQLINALEDAIAPDIAQRYGWDQEYVRKGLLEKCALAMVDAFEKRPQLFSIYEKTEKKK
jgi:hypothetical protein